MTNYDKNNPPSPASKSTRGAVQSGDIDPIAVERALDETVERIERATIARVGSAHLSARLSAEAKNALRDRYRPTYLKALKEGRKWEVDRHRVLLRADQVGYIAAFALLALTVAAELRRAGVGEKPGQEIEIQPLTLPDVNAALIEVAASHIDCDKPSGPSADWDWCSRQGARSFKAFVQQVISTAEESFPAIEVDSVR